MKEERYFSEKNKKIYIYYSIKVNLIYLLYFTNGIIEMSGYKR